MAQVKDCSDSKKLINRKWILTCRPKDLFDATKHAELVKEPVDLDAVAQDHVVVDVEALSVDAFIRVMLNGSDEKEADDKKENDDPEQEANRVHGNIAVGDTIPAIGIGVVRQCASGKFKQGSRVTGMLGAQSVATVPESGLTAVMNFPYVKPSASLNVLGISGLTAYVGIHHVLGPPKKGQTVVVSAAAGATGNIAAQLAKATGARVVGIAGGSTKQKFLLETLKLDGAIDYKHPTKTFEQQLDEQCPDGVDFFYDNVGGPQLDMVLEHINRHARVVICGAISQYSNLNSKEKMYGPSNYLRLSEQSATMSGFVLTHFMHGYKALNAICMLLWYYWRGIVVSHEQVEEGIESFGPALQKLFAGGNTGRLLVDVSGSLKE